MNSLTANNRLSQQLVVSVAEHLLLRHECRLPNHLAVSNHRELYLTVGGELCRNLTAGFVTEEGFMFMLFVGSQKHSALSIFAKTTRMSALVLCGNSGVILLSVKDHQHIDSAIPGRYTVQAPYKAGAGRGNPEFTKAHNRALAVFLCHEQHYAQIMVGRAGPTSVGPGSLVTGISTPVRLTTNKVVESLGGELLKITKEAAIMATIPTLSQPEIAIVDGQAVTSSLAVADFFSKRHDDVLKKIRILDCSPEFCARNFAETSILVRQPNGGTRKLPCYQITRDGFAFLAMGFTGKRAAQFKEAYINAFNQMEKQLSKPAVPSDVAHNASVLCSYISSIHQVWLQQLYPMLAKAESPLAVSLYDYINDASALACLINLSLNPSEVRGRK
ncbi:peptidase [Escherichia coli]|uniref:Rha family phage regulatory protein n=5 Tax=Escherichia coli TaxID=562 RepID=UPI001365E336|nr:peptidase [Escherichia coli]EFM6589616.1 peptidase [Escherichia coli]EGB3310858.1 peptidase [Escherichia coli]MWG08547.1 peptidase [Escherichia coli]HAH9641545.1 peptidase [Escherichia coli]